MIRFELQKHSIYSFAYFTDDVLEENQHCKEENKRLMDIIDDNITTLFERVDHNADDISALGSSVALNTIHRTDNSDLLSIVSTNVSTVSSRVDEVSFEVIENTNSILLNTASIDELISDSEFNFLKSSRIYV